MSTPIEQIKTLRQSIRYHRDQKGDDRCWLDDHRLWSLLEDTQPKTIDLPSFDQMMETCGAFYLHRRADTPDVIPADAMRDPSYWNDDLQRMNEAELQEELLRTQTAIRKHRDIESSKRTLENDRELYRILPEKMSADFRLPSKEAFLGEEGAPNSGCPSFWRSHQNCTTKQHDLHKWGPCSDLMKS